MRKLLLWAAWNIPLGPLAPWALGLAIGKMPTEAKDDSN